MSTIRRRFLRLITGFRSDSGEADPARDGRWFPGFKSWWLDLKLGARMLRKHPGLALVGGFGIAVGVAIAAGAYSVIYGAFLATSLPLDEGDRIVSIETWDSAASRPERRILHDFRLWREELKSVREISAFRTVTLSLTAPGVQPVSVPVASMSASGFGVARVRPMLGRYLTEDDEREGAPWVVVLSENVWRSRFGSDPGIVGRTIQLGSSPHEIDVEMPEGFAFPVNHRFWTPLRIDSTPSEPLTGPELMVFGRLAPGVTLNSAQAELATLGRRAAMTSPDAYDPLQPRVTPYANPFMGLHQGRDVSSLHFMQGVIVSMLVLICLNVAILVYSRTVTRQTEIAVRTALGADRGRIVAQLFLEALVLSAVAALAGVAIAELALRQAARATRSIASELPFWMSFHLSSDAVLYAAALGVLAAAIVGVAPALQATRRQVQVGLRRIGAGGSGMRLGKTWTFLIVAQVGFAVALLPVAVSGAWTSMRAGFADPGFRLEEFLSAELGIDGAPGAHFADRHAELMRRLEAEPGVSSVTFSMVNPGEERNVRIEAQSVAGQAQSESRDARFNRVDVDFFQAFDVPILAGRGFTQADILSAGESQSIVINHSFAQAIFGGDALGRLIRYSVEDARRSVASLTPEPGPWYEVVGIISDFPAGAGPEIDASALKLYHPAAAGDVQPVTLALRVLDGAPSTFAGRLQEIASAVDPHLYLRSLVSLDEALRREQWLRRFEAAVLAAVTLSVVLLSAAGIYALMSITVSQRRKEIGIRLALGAGGTRIMTGIFARAMGQLGVGAAVGAVFATALIRASADDLMRGNAAVVLPGVALLMMAVGLLAALGPARRCLKIEPIEALREQ